MKRRGQVGKKRPEPFIRTSQSAREEFQMLNAALSKSPSSIHKKSLSQQTPFSEMDDFGLQGTHVSPRMCRDSSLVLHLKSFILFYHSDLARYQIKS